MARRRRGRQIDGILLFDKPAGMSSNQALQKVRRLFDANKAGHTGNLDGPATGLLPLCFGEATKMSTFLLDERKRYLCEVTLGTITTTLDAQGEVIKTLPVPKINHVEFETLLDQYRGPIEQIPPMFSALKHQGERLYKLAMAGKEVERKPRPVTIYDLHITAYTESGFIMDVACSKGTYIRTLADDIGQSLGCGAHVKSLRRTEVGDFNIQAAFSLETLTEKVAKDEFNVEELLLPMDSGIDFPAVELDHEATKLFMQGQSILQEKQEWQGLTRVYAESGEFLGIADMRIDARLAPKRLIVTNKV